MSIRRFVLTLPALVLVLLLLAGVFPGGAAFAEGGGDPLALRFVCDETVASVTVYDPAGLPLPVGADGIHHLTPGTYFYSATAEGYESTGLQAFTIPADAAGDQELRISLTPVPGSVPPGASTPGQTPPDASVPGQTPVNVPDPNAPEENPEDDGKLRIRPVDGSLTLTIERETKTESAVPPEVQNLLEGKQKPLLTPDGMPVEKKLYLKTPDAEELYLDRLAVEKEIGYYTTDWTVLNLIDEEGDRKSLLPVSGWYDVTVSGPATEPYRAYEPVFALVTLHWDEEGDIVDRDVQILETTHTPTKSSWSFSTDTLSTLVIAVPTDRPYIDETAKKPALTERTLVSGDGKVEVSGLLPEDAQLVVVEIPLSFAAELYSIRTGEAKAEEEILFAYDISILSGGEKFQPEDFGESVRVSVGGLKTGEEPSDVLHVKADAVNGAGALDLSAVGAAGSAESELLPVSAEDGVVAFETEGFSVFIGATKGSPLRGVAASGDCGDNLTWKLEENGTLTISGTGAIWSYLEWGDHRNNIKSVVIENGVTSIGGSAFADCGNLENVTFAPGSQLASIGDYAFYDCGKLGSIEIPSGVTSIGDYAFYDCADLEFVTFADGSQLERIGDYAFNLNHFTSITIPAGVKSIGKGAFSDSPYLMSVEIPASVTGIGNDAFSECDDLRYITFGGKLEQWRGLSPSSFIDNYDSGLTIYCSDSCGNDLSWKLENGTLTISGTGAMFDYNLLETPWHYDGIFNLNIEEGVTSIGENAFWRFRLSRLVIPSGVTSIGENAFGDCWILQNATIPASVRSIGELAFYHCDRLEYICYVGTRENWDKISSSSYVHAGCKIIAACADLDDGGTVAFDTESGVTVTATPNSGYSFVNWTENGNVVTGEDGKPVGASYSFNVVADRNLVAHFVKPVSVNLQVTKEFNDWGKADSFTFNLAAVTAGAPMPANSTAVATEDETTASFGPITYDTAETYEYTITEVNGGADGVSYDTTPHKVVVTVTKAEDATNALSATVTYDGQPYLNVTNTFATTTATLQVTKSFNDWSKAPQGFTFTLAPVDNAPMPANNTTATATATKADPTAVFGEITYDKAGTYKYTITEVNGGADGVTYDTTPHNVVVTVSKAEDETNALSAEVKYDGADRLTITNTYATATAPTISEQPADLNWTYGDTTTKELSVSASVSDGGTLSYQWYLNTADSTTGGTEVTGATSEKYTVPGETQTDAGTYYYYCVVTNTKNGATATATSNTAAVTVDRAQLTITAQDQNYIYNGQTQGEGDTTYNDQAVIAEKITVGEGQLKGTDTVTSVTIDGQGKDPDTYDLTASAAAIGLNGNKTANYAISYVKGKLTILPPAVAEINVTKVLEGRNWKDGDSFTFELAAVNGAPMPAKDTATAKKDEPTASFGEVTYYSVGPFEYTITESKGSLDGVTYDTAPHTVLVTVAQSDPKQAPTATVAYDGAASLTVTNSFTPAKAALQVTKSLDTWRAGDSFSFTLAAVTENAPMPATAQATATEANPAASFGEVTYDRAGTWEYTITETDGGKPGVTYDTAAHNVVVTVSKNATTNALSATVAYDGADSLTVTNSRPLRDVVIDSSITGGAVSATPASAAEGDPVTLTVTPDVGSELTSLTVTDTDTGAVIKTEQDPNDPNLFRFEMPAAGVTVSASFEEILYRVVEGADSSWLKGSNGDLSIRVKRDPKDETCFQHFRKDGKGSVAIDGAVLSEDTSALIQKDYKAEEGSTVITLHKKMLNRLSAGKHTVTITFDDGSVSTGLTILVPAGGYSPGTGDSSRIGFWAALMVLAGLGFAGADYARRKLRRPRYVGKH